MVPTALMAVYGLIGSLTAPGFSPITSPPTMLISRLAAISVLCAACRNADLAYNCRHAQRPRQSALQRQPAIAACRRRRDAQLAPCAGLASVGADGHRRRRTGDGQGNVRAPARTPGYGGPRDDQRSAVISVVGDGAGPFGWWIRCARDGGTPSLTLLDLFWPTRCVGSLCHWSARIPRRARLARPNSSVARRFARHSFSSARSPQWLALRERIAAESPARALRVARLSTSRRTTAGPAPRQRPTALCRRMLEQRHGSRRHC